eukprot:366025-Chlamydomonas_euryale.AAC.7
MVVATEAAEGCRRSPMASLCSGNALRQPTACVAAPVVDCSKHTPVMLMLVLGQTAKIAICANLSQMGPDVPHTALLKRFLLRTCPPARQSAQPCLLNVPSLAGFEPHNPSQQHIAWFACLAFLRQWFSVFSKDVLPCLLIYEHDGWHLLPPTLFDCIAFPPYWCHGSASLDASLISKFVLQCGKA